MSTSTPVSSEPAAPPPSLPTALNIDALDRLLAPLNTEQLLRQVILDAFPGRTVVTTSFGAESAVLLALIAGIAPATPVVFLDTGYLFAQTLTYRDRLVDHLGLTDVRTVIPDPDDLAREDPKGDLHKHDPDRCCRLRKDIPLENALGGFDVWISGRKRFHGCFPCTEPTGDGGYSRAGRWTGSDKTECGIHTPKVRRNLVSTQPIFGISPVSAQCNLGYKAATVRDTCQTRLSRKKTPDHG